jgi:cell division septation protein DedD
MRNRETPSLPEGYWTTQVAGAWYAFNPWDVLVAGPADAATVQRHAWYDAWRRIDRELHAEAAAFYSDGRPLHALPHLREFFRMLAAGAKTDPASEARSHAVTPSGRRRPTLVAGVVIAVLAAATAGIAPEPPRPLSHTVDREYPMPASTAAQNHPASRPHQLRVATIVQPAAPTRTLATTVRIRGVSKTAYVVLVGKYASSSAAEKVKRLVQRKGYVVHVVPYGLFSEVITPPLPTRRQAEGVARGLEAVGLQAKLMTWREQ